MKKIDFTYVTPGSSFIHPLFSEDGKKVLDPRVVLTAELIASFNALYNGILFYKPERERVTIPHYRVKIAYNNSREILDEVEKTNKLSKNGYNAAVKVVDEVLNDLNSIDVEAIDLLKDLLNYDEYLYNHSVNVGFMSAVFAMKSGWFSEDEIRSLSIAAYLHDIGHRQIDRQLLNKEGKFDISEFQKIKRHPQLGYEMIKSVNSSDAVIQQGVLFHHEKMNNEGYYQLPYENLPIYPKIISLCDIYDALTTTRPFRKKPFSIKQALIALVNSIDSIFDYDLVRTFMTLMPPLLTDNEVIISAGDICALNTDELALVTESNPLEYMKPKVKVFCGFTREKSQLVVRYYNEAVSIDLNKDHRYLKKILTNEKQIAGIRTALAERKIIDTVK